MTDRIVLEEFTSKIQTVGYLRQDIIDLLGIPLPAKEILMYPGAIKHMKKRPEHFEMYFQRIPDIINNPDYIGVHPSELNSIEFVKVLEGNVLVAVKLDPKGYLYLSSMYELTPSKVPKRLKSGRLIQVPK
jgi:phage-Barnase-EndoU-ColicinE5/D-RelE like nuclease3